MEDKCVKCNVSLSPLSGEVLMMVYTKGKIDKGTVEFDISTKKYKSVTAFKRTDKYYFIITTPKSFSIADSAIAELESSIVLLRMVATCVKEKTAIYGN